MKKKYLLLLTVLPILVGCSNSCPSKCDIAPDIEFKNNIDGYVPYLQETSESGKSFIVDKNGNPQLILSSLLRTDLSLNADFFKANELEDYFAIAKETGFNTFDLVITRREVEPSKNKYNFDDLKVYLDYAKKYDLKLNILWYGSIVDGETHGANVPQYILNNKKTYPLLVDLFDGGVYGRYCILDWSNKNLVSREQKALYSLCNYIASRCEEETLKDPVVMIQLGQGVDRFYRWRIGQYTIPGKETALMSQDEAEEMTNYYLNEMGRAVKYSSYKALTRAEFCEQSSVINYVRNAKNNEFVDMVCPTYLHDVSAMRNGIKSFVEEYEDMAVINVENWANDINYKATLANISLGASGYTCYQLSAPIYYPELPNGALYERYNASGTTLEEKFTPKGTRVEDTKSVVNALNNAYIPAATTSRANFASFGFDNRISSNEQAQKIYLNSGILIDYNKAISSIGFAIYSSSYLYCYSKEDAQMKFTNCSLITASEGNIDENGDWNPLQTVSLAENTTLSLAGGKTYRIKVASVDALPDSKKLLEKGYYSTYDSIRSA